MFLLSIQTNKQIQWRNIKKHIVLNWKIDIMWMICAHWFQLKVNCYVELANIFVVCMIKGKLGQNIRNSEKYPAFYYEFLFVWNSLFQGKSI